MAFKLKSSGPFKMMGSSPAKEKQLTGIEMKIANERRRNPDKAKQLERVAKNMGLIESPAKQIKRATDNMAEG